MGPGQGQANGAFRHLKVARNLGDAGPLAEHLRRFERDGVLKRGDDRIRDGMLKPLRGRSRGVLRALLTERAKGR